MASDIVITPNRGSTTVNAKIDFTGASTASSQIRLEVLPDNSLSFVGTTGSLFSIADSVTGSLMSVNDASGLPILEVFDTDKVVMGQYNQNTLVVNGTQVGIGTGSPTNKLTIAGVNSNGITLTGSNATITAAGTTPNLILSAGTNIYARPGSGYDLIVDSGNGINVTTGNIRAPAFYYSSDTNSRWVNGYQLYLRGTSPTIFLRDTDQNSAMIHVNSNIFYILRGANDTETWTQVNSRWPMEIDLTNNNMAIGGNLNVAAGTGTVTAATFSGALSGNATTATTLQTARNLTINGTARSFNGSADISWTAADIGLTSYLPLTGGTISSNLTITGNLTVNGTTTTVNSTTVTIDDPIFTLGGDTAPASDDNKDRGIEFRWHNGTAAKAGFFGFDDSTGYFTFIPDSTNTSEVFSGTQGDIQASNFRGNVVGGTVTVAGTLTINKNGTNSDIIFPAQANDPGYIRHYESNNTAYMYFNVSDDTNDEFHFGYSGDPSTFRLRSDGTVLEGIWQGSSITTTYTDAKVATLTGQAGRILIQGGVSASAQTLGLSIPVAFDQTLKNNARNITGGGTITVSASGEVKWSARFIIISGGRGANYATSGYWDIDCPTSGTITGVGGAANQTANANGIPMGGWQALYYILPIGSGNGSLAANFRLVHYSSDLDIPIDWVLICVRNSDTDTFYFPNGVVLGLGGASARGLQTSANTANAVVIRDASGNFSAGTVTAALSGNAGTATTWQTARNFTIGSTARSVNGSSDYSWTVADIGAAVGLPAYQAWSFDSVKTPGLYQYDGAIGATKPPDGSANYRTIEVGSSTRYSQIALPWDSDNMYFRRQTNSTWTTWRTVLTDGNYNSYAPTLTGTGASGTWGISITGNAATATTLQTARTIAGVSFNGSANITLTGQNISTSSGTAANDIEVAKYLRWKNYGNNHILIDASAGTNPGGGAIDRYTPGNTINSTGAGSNTWGEAISLMGWNGSATYGVRVDRARSIDNQANSATITATSANTASQIVQRDSNGDFQARNITTQDDYTNGWFRNNSNNTGLYNQSTYLHLSSTGANTSYLDISTVGSTNSGIRFYTGGHVNTLRGYIVANTSNELMLWNAGGSYSARFTSTQSEIYQDTYVPTLYANIMYDRQNASFYVDPGSTSVFNRLTVAGYTMRSSTTIDMSNTGTYATTNYYPVTIPIGTGMPTRMRIVNALNSNVPSWATHGSGFTCHVEWTSNGSGWGTIAVQRSIHRYTEGYTNSTICGGITQMTNSSTEVIWLRGGGIYYFEADADVTPTPRSTTYTVNSQSVTFQSSAVNDVLSAATDTRPSFQRLNLTQSTGTAPMTVSSTTLVTNLNADLLDGYNSAETGSSIILRTQSNGYLNIDNWIQVGSAGLYSSVNSAHWTPNQTGAYSPWRIINSRGSYGGIYDDYSGVNWMHDSAGNGGIYRQANSRWILYHSIANNCTGIGSSATTSGYAMQVNGNSYVTGYERVGGGNLYIDGNYGRGVVGLYASTRYQGVFAMGDSYKLADDGTTTGTLYGIAWSHPNAGGVAANLNTHGALVMENGTFLAAISGSIRCRDDMRAPIFYDSNDTTYYIDPSSGQANSEGGKIKWNFTVNGEGATSGRGLALYPSYTSSVPTYGITFAQTASLGTHGNVTADWATYFTMNNTANRGWIFRDGNTPANVASINNAGRMRIASLGVNTDASATNGEIRATDNITAYYSDERLKTKLGAIENPIEKVKSLSGFYFEANETAVALGYQKKREVGVSAQEVQAILPEIIAPAPIDDKYMTVRYEKLIPLLIEAIKEQQKQIEELKSLLSNNK